MSSATIDTMSTTHFNTAAHAVHASLLLSLALCIPKLCSGQDIQGETNQVAAESESSQDGVRSRHMLYRSIASGLQFVPSADALRPLKLSDAPVLTWASLGGWSGDVFVWTGNGQIQIVGCVGSQETDAGPKVFLEFHSFASSPIASVRLDPSATWRVPIEMNPAIPIPGAPTPSTSARRRLLQLRSLAKWFSVGMQLTDERKEASLRLLPQPLARESNDDADVIDSALFAFVSSAGTDPEALLLIETGNVDEKLTFTYQAARLTTREIWMSLKGVEIWRVPAFTNYSPGATINDDYFFHNVSD
ncbi:hypothetical protein Poly21_25840 [Allorhodopirellula heiligendammensis]|uniref:Uncharacterized protein n=2 Tax=Allorhodopirellula heiligendammensis TaxID=2714739 RepID=A0A5C6BXI3_9BACT|nr:hypothetical protein Poly21_25840 [Allorhodopirellula heiligendammensis]